MWSQPHVWPPCGHGCLLPWAPVDPAQGAKMCASKSSGSLRTSLRAFAVAAIAALLGACAQSSVHNDRSAALAANRQVANESRLVEPRAAPPRTASSIIHRRVAVTRRPNPTSVKPTPEDEGGHGIASYYNQGIQTANGEKFDPGELTAAHRTLPFGTRLRVTNVATGQSVTVRVNDRGPFIPGRVVDLSEGAAESLGIVHRGIAKVKLDVVD